MTSYDEDEMDAAEKAMFDRLRGRVTPATVPLAERERAVVAAALDVTPSLEEFAARFREDDNEWWRLASGHQLNLFEDALHQLSTTLAGVEAVRALHVKSAAHDYCVIDHDWWPCRTVSALRDAR